MKSILHSFSGDAIYQIAEAQKEIQSRIEENVSEIFLSPYIIRVGPCKYDNLRKTIFIRKANSLVKTVKICSQCTT